MQNSQNQENPDSNENRRTTGFGIGQAFTTAAASLRAVGTRAQELVEGTTNAVLSSLPLSRIRATEPRPLSSANNNLAIENQQVRNVLTLANTRSQTNLSQKGSCVNNARSLTDLAEKTAQGTEHLKEPAAVLAGETTTGQRPAVRPEPKLPNNDFFKGSSIIKTNLQLEQVKEKTKGTETLKAPAVQTPAGHSELSNIDFFKRSFITKTNIKQKLAEGTAKVSENLKVPPGTQIAAGQSDLPYIDFFNEFSSFKTTLYLKHSEVTAKGTEHLKACTTQTTSGQPESRIQIQTPTEKAGTSVEPIRYVQSNLQSTGAQTDEKTDSVVNSVKAQSQVTERNAESGLLRKVSKSQRLEVLAQEETVPSFFRNHRLSNLTRQVSTYSQTRQYLINTSKTKKTVVSRQSETTPDFKIDHRHSNVSQRPEINIIHHRYLSQCESQIAVPTSTSCRITSSSGRRFGNSRLLSTEPNFTSHIKRPWDASSKSNDLSLHRRKARCLSEVVEQRRLISGPVKTTVATQDSQTEIAERNEVQDRRSRTIPYTSISSILPLRSENGRARRWATEGRATHNEQRNTFLNGIKNLFGRCAGYRRRH